MDIPIVSRLVVVTGDTNLLTGLPIPAYLAVADAESNTLAAIDLAELGEAIEAAMRAKRLSKETSCGPTT